MKKYYLLILLIIAICFDAANAFAFDDKITHPAITKAAIQQSELVKKDYLKNNLGFENGIGEVIAYNPDYPNDETKKIDIETVIENGAHTEDTGIQDLGRLGSCSRGLNHFYDPLKSINDTSAGLDEWTYEFAPGSLKPIYFPWYWSGKSNLLWATSAGYSNLLSVDHDPTEDEQKSTDYNCYSWNVAREVFLKALTTNDNADRNKNFARMFRSVGQIVHLLQDMAVPAHVRNDMKGHLYFQQFALNLPPNWLGNNFEAYVLKKGIGAQAAYVPSFNKITDYWDSDLYNGWLADSMGNGLAEYTQANFLSEFSMMGDYSHPSISDGFDYETPEVIQERDGKLDNRFYFKKTEGEPVDHLMAESYLGEYLQTGGSNSCFLDEKCYADYAAKLVPKAIGYSAGVMNYFFRGTLEITMPSRYMYSIADGSKLKSFQVQYSDGSYHDVQQEYFDYIKAKVKNTTIVTSPSEKLKPDGKLWAIAKYKKLKHYQAALASVVPPETDKEDIYSYSVSAEISNTTDLAEAEEFQFKFEDANAIPVGITDLTLQVVYQGTMGNELNTAIAVGMKDLTEPTHFSYFNGTDQVYFWNGISGGNDCGNIFRTANQMESKFNNQEFSWDPPFTAPEWDGSGEQGWDCVPWLHSNESLRGIGCGNDGFPCLYPYDAKVQLSFYPLGGTLPENPHVIYPNLPGGRYGRMILLCDDSTAKLSVRIDREPRDINAPPWINIETETGTCKYIESRYKTNSTVEITPSRNQDGVTPTGSVTKFREVRQHGSDFFSNWEFSIKDCNPPVIIWPVMETPAPVGINADNFNP